MFVWCVAVGVGVYKRVLDKRFLVSVCAGRRVVLDGAFEFRSDQVLIQACVYNACETARN